MFPISEASIRLTTAAVAIVDVMLIFAVALQLYGRGSEWAAVGAAALLAFSPAHLFYGRLAVDVLYPLPFILAWLLLMIHPAACERPRRLFAAGLVLGCSLYTYASADVAAPVLLLLTLALTVAHDRQRAARRAVSTVAGFAVALVPFAVWHIVHPERIAQVMTTYATHEPGVSVLRGLRGLGTYTGIGDRVGAYWASLGPSFLFFFGDPGMTDSTRRAGVFLIPMAVLIATGLYALGRNNRSTARVLLVGGFFTAPLAATITPALTTRRILAILPFGVLLGVEGARYLIRHAPRGAVVVAVLGALSAGHFAVFYIDYHTDYRLRSAAWFELNTRELVEQIAEVDGRRGGTDRIYVDAENPFIPEYVQFYSRKLGRSSLPGRVVYRDVPEQIDPATGLIVVRQLANRTAETACAGTPPLVTAAVIREPDAKPSFVICTK
jgi:hypothetical protein